MCLNKFFFTLLLTSFLLIPLNAQITYTGYVKKNNQPVSNITVYFYYIDFDGYYETLSTGVTTSSGFFTIPGVDIWHEGLHIDLDYINSNPEYFRFRCSIPTNLPCPNEPDAYMSLNYIANVYNNYNFNFTVTPLTGNGVVSGTIKVNWNPAPYHTKAVLYRPNGTMLGVATTFDNSGNYSFGSSTTPYGTNRLEVTVYTNPVTVQNFYFCVNQPSEVFDPNLTISGYTQGYVTGVVKNSCDPVANQIVYFQPKVGNGMTTGWVPTNSLGEYTSYNLPKNLYQFRTTVGGQTIYKNIDVVSGLYANQHFLFGILCDEENKTELSSEEMNIPDNYTLYQNFPNPFNPSTTIKYFLVDNAQVNIKVVDINGQEVRSLVDEFQNQGYQEVIWDAKNNAGQNVSSGVYFYQLTVGQKILTNKMLLMR